VLSAELARSSFKVFGKLCASVHNICLRRLPGSCLNCCVVDRRCHFLIPRVLEVASTDHSKFGRSL